MAKVIKSMIDPEDAVMLLIDHQSGLFQLVKEYARKTAMNIGTHHKWRLAMKSTSLISRSATAALCLGVAIATLTGCATTPNSKLAHYEEAEQIATIHISKFDDLDFNVFTNQQWDRLHESHSKDITVHWPDGHYTKGIEKHIEDLKAMFVYAPDTRIKVHPVKVASGDWTSVIGVMEGTFTKPMPTPDGKMIQPTGKPFKLTMCTVGHWRDGVMDEEYLFWDNQTFMRQIGLGN